MHPVTHGAQEQLPAAPWVSQRNFVRAISLQQHTPLNNCWLGVLWFTMVQEVHNIALFGASSVRMPSNSVMNPHTTDMDSELLPGPSTEA
jgi:hypothetical protein